VVRAAGHPEQLFSAGDSLAMLLAEIPQTPETDQF
jgi:hypothetical protein